MRSNRHFSGLFVAKIGSFIDGANVMLSRSVAVS